MEAWRMTEFQRLFLVQARSDFAVFELLKESSALPPCHAIHYLQMSTEMLGKAHAWKRGPQAGTHRAFVAFLRDLKKNHRAQKMLRFDGQNANWQNTIRKSIPLAESIEDLAPSLSPDAPNPEYPWPRNAPHTAPAEHDFGIWRHLMGTPEGRSFLDLTAELLSAADAFL
jgi:hypothetical protein